MNTNF